MAEDADARSQSERTPQKPRLRQVMVELYERSRRPCPMPMFPTTVASCVADPGGSGELPRGAAGAAR